MNEGVLDELQRYRLVVEHSSNMVVITDALRRIEYVNAAYTRVTGWTLDEVRGLKPGRLLHGPLTDVTCAREISRALSRGETINGVELVNYRKDGEPYWVSLHIRPVHNECGQLTHFVAIQTDITERRRARDALVASERRLAEAQRLARMASFECNFDTDEMLWTPGADQVIGLPEALLPRSFRGHVSLLHADDREALEDAYWTLVSEQRPYEVEYRLLTGEGRVRWIRERGYYLPAEGALPSRLCGLVFDISATKEAHDRIQYLAWHDTLTGLANREQLQDVLLQRLAGVREAGRQLALLFVDLDRFKTINDSLGHHVGDELLQTCAQRLRDAVRSSDVVGRLGGDEFVVVLGGIDSSDIVARIATKLLERIATPMLIQGRELHVTASLGISVYPKDGTTASELMRHADAAMYQAKARGRNTHCFFSEALNARLSERFELESQLRLALVRRELSLHFQPQFQSDGARLIGFEALLRWQTPEGRWIPPDQFIPVAEESGLIQPIGDWVLEEACSHWQQWRAQYGANIRVAVNLSAIQLRDRGLLARIRQLTERFDMPPGALELELTEAVAMHDPGASIELMKQLRELQVSLAVDDFGTGYSSLAYLKTLPIQRIKLDRSFVKDMEHNPDDQAICKAAIQMAHSLGLEVVAEGVETEAQRQFLSHHRCDLMQGYHLGRPMPAQDVLHLLAQPPLICPNTSTLSV
jgi:diguanylate cyclase (GGDEF)-like protein/PAS domain S-box-containing protein